MTPAEAIEATPTSLRVPSGAEVLRALTAAGYSVVRLPSVTRLGRVVWATSRADEGTISVIGADHVARVVLALLTEATDG